MRALTAIAATAYAIGLWMFAPRTIWERELETAKRNQRTRPTKTPTPATVPTPEFEASAQPEQIPDTAIHSITEIVEPIPDPQPIEPDTNPIEPDTVAPEPPNLGTLTTTQLRELAKKQKLNWRPLINGKRKPLNKPQLIQLLTA